jgi:hypothetical protein
MVRDAREFRAKSRDTVHQGPHPEPHPGSAFSWLRSRLSTPGLALLVQLNVTKYFRPRVENVPPDFRQRAPKPRLKSRPVEPTLGEHPDLFEIEFVERTVLLPTWRGR